jgi:hypothetical protein
VLKKIVTELAIICQCAGYGQQQTQHGQNPHDIAKALLNPCLATPGVSEQPPVTWKPVDVQVALAVLVLPAGL